MKVLVVGDWLAEIYEESFYNAFKEHGCNVARFSWIQYFKYYQYANRFEVKCNPIASFYYRIQNRFTFGPVVSKINNDLVRVARTESYDLIFIYRGTHVYPKTIKALKKTGALVFGYNNDDPFSKYYPKYFWRHFLRGVKDYDYIFSYREKNIQDYSSIGYSKTSILRSYYLKNNNYHMSVVREEYYSDVVFIGHFEDDGRDKIILYLLNSGVKLKLYGTGWERSVLYDDIKKMVGAISPVYSEYNEVLNGAKIALVFLSKKNNDTYTRRVFEIPATKTVMVSEYTDDMATMFESRKEIFFFSDKEECLNVINELLSQPQLIQDVAEQAYNRLIEDGHEVFDRVTQVIEEYRNEKDN